MARADRYTYVALVGVFILCVQEAATLANACLFHLPSKWRTVIIASTAAAVIAVSAWLAWQQTGTWRNSISVFSQALAATEDNYIAHANLGAALYAAGHKDEGLQHYKEAIRLHAPALDYHQRAGANAESAAIFKTPSTTMAKSLRSFHGVPPCISAWEAFFLKRVNTGELWSNTTKPCATIETPSCPALESLEYLIAQQRFLEARVIIEVIRRLEPANEEARALLRSLPPA